MSVSRSLGLWRLVRAVPRAASIARPIGRNRLTLPRPVPLRTVSCLGWRQLSTQSNADSYSGSPEPDADSTLNSGPESTSDPGDPDLTSDLDDPRSAVLEAALLHVPALGWTPAALEEGAKSVGVPESAEDMFPRGGGELIDYFEVQCNADLLDYMQQCVEQESVMASKLLEDAVEQRLRMIIPFINKWPQAMAVKAFPSNAPTALENLAHMVDDIWHCTGDRSTDFNWYTKRALLVAIYSSTELFLVQDASVDFQDTWGFLRRRMEDSNTFAKASRELGGVVSGGVEMLSAGFTTTMNMLGKNSQDR